MGSPRPPLPIIRLSCSPSVLHRPETSWLPLSPAHITTDRRMWRSGSDCRAGDEAEGSLVGIRRPCPLQSQRLAFRSKWFLTLPHGPRIHNHWTLSTLIKQKCCLRKKKKTVLPKHSLHSSDLASLAKKNKAICSFVCFHWFILEKEPSSLMFIPAAVYSPITISDFSYNPISQRNVIDIIKQRKQSNVHISWAGAGAPFPLKV